MKIKKPAKRFSVQVIRKWKVYLSVKEIVKMCMVKENLFNKEKELKQTNVNSDWTQLFRKVRAFISTLLLFCSENWEENFVYVNLIVVFNRFLFLKFQPLKPKLTRKIVSSAKLNLNRYWHKFEELLNTDNAKRPFEDSTTYRLLPLVNKKIKRETLTSKSTTLIERNNVHDEINSFMSKNFTVEKNYARSSMYKHFNDESLYHGVNLNLPRQRCSCSILPSMVPSKYPFSHRNIQLTYEDKENLENEAMEVYNNYGYDITF